jgi:hypothetical protein
MTLLVRLDVNLFLLILYIAVFQGGSGEWSP